MNGNMPEPIGRTPLGGVAAITLSTLLVVWASPSPDTAAPEASADAATEVLPAGGMACRPADELVPSEELVPSHEKTLSREGTAGVEPPLPACTSDCSPSTQSDEPAMRSARADRTTNT